MEDDATFGGDVFGGGGDYDGISSATPAAAAAAAADQEDLYDDLKLQAAVPKKANSRVHDDNNCEATKQLKAQLERLQKENTTLKRNISTFYRTAQHELQRKQKRIATLEAQLLDHGKSGKKK